MDASILKKQIGTFLKEFKIIVSEDGMNVIPRKKNNGALLEMGYTKQNRKNEIMALSVADYIAGPEIDDDETKRGYVWIFGKSIGKMNIYIKLKIAGSGNKKFAICISFHLADHPMLFPYKNIRSKE